MPCWNNTSDIMWLQNQRNWIDLLDSAQFCYNLHQSAATGMSPFELAMGQ
ncbi:hypothetical protein CsSME_00010532 [Camellia sinensis var. sinensis]